MIMRLYPLALCPILKSGNCLKLYSIESSIAKTHFNIYKILSNLIVPFSTSGLSFLPYLFRICLPGDIQAWILDRNVSFGEKNFEMPSI